MSFQCPLGRLFIFPFSDTTGLWEWDKYFYFLQSFPLGFMQTPRFLVSFWLSLTTWPPCSSLTFTKVMPHVLLCLPRCIIDLRLTSSPALVTSSISMYFHFYILKWPAPADTLWTLYNPELPQALVQTSISSCMNFQESSRLLIS